MSESEKRKRRLYRRNRERWIFTQTVIIIVVAVAVLISALVSFQLNQKYYIGYTEGGTIDYDVYLKENEFYDTPHLDKNQSYVASLIDKIIASFYYEINMDTDDVNYRYSYTIKSRLEIIDDTSDVPIFNPEYELINVQNKSQSSSNRLNINEIVVLNYDEYNVLADRFLETYDLKGSTTSNIVLTLNVDVLSDCSAFSGSSIDTYSSELRIPLTTKTVNIKMTSTVPDAEAKMIACTRGAGSEVFKTTAIVLGIADVLLILLLVAFIYLTRTEDITYTARVKKIVSQYKSYIQKIKNLFETHGYQIIVVDTFDELLEIKDTIQAPILMYENEDKTCAKFMIPTDSKLLYLYEIKVDGYVEPRTEPKQEPVPTTVVKPNITNVVRPIVKVVVTPSAPSTPPPPAPEPDPEPDPEPEIETLFEDAEVEIETEEEEMPEVIVTTEEAEEAIPEEEPEEITPEEEPEEITPEEEPEEITPEEIVPEEIIPEAPPEEIPLPQEEEVTEEASEAMAFVEETETDAELEEIFASIPEADEETVDENTVDAIDIFWEERPNKTYRYDPDGNTVEEGDIVLVPSRDVASDKDIVREAEVARGNYKIDAATLDRPLKKIIGVVKRKAEQFFTAMITPQDENEEQK